MAALEGWTECGRGGDGTGEQPAPIAIPPREPPGNELAPAAIETKQAKQGEIMQKQWEAVTRAQALAWDCRSSYPGYESPPNVGDLSKYSAIPEQR
jgi:hypothetical protein